MAAMRVAAMCHYDSRLVGLSVILAIVISFVALWLAFLAREESKGWALRKILSATVMGAAIPVMHYTAMAAAHFINSDAARGSFAFGQHLHAGIWDHDGNHHDPWNCRSHIPI